MLKIKLDNLISYSLVGCLIVFTFFSAHYWLGKEVSGNLYKAIILLELVSLFTIIYYLRSINNNGFVIGSLIWAITIPVIILWNQGNILHLLTVVLWPICFLSVYALIKYNNQIFNKLNYGLIIIYVIGMYLFIMARLNPQNIIIQGVLQNNMIFYPLLTTPWVLSLKNKKLSVILFIILFVAVLFSLKRSAILIISLILIPYISVNANFIKGRLLNWLFIILLFMIFIFVFQRINESVGGLVISRIESISEDKGSSRLAIYREVLQLQVKSSIDEWFFGHGHLGVIRDSSRQISAHNDFLEILYDYGVLIFGIYIILWISLLRQLFKMLKRRDKLLLPYYSSLVIFFVMSMVSHLVIYANYFIFLVLFWGGILGMENAKINNKQNLVD